MLDRSQLTQRLIGAIKEQQAEISTSAMMRPDNDIHKVGVLAGRYQGLQSALDTLEAILSDEYDKEKYS
jgi:hypothetical protein